MWTYAIKRIVAFIPVYIAVMAFITYISWEQMNVVDAHLGKSEGKIEKAELMEDWGLTGNVFVRNLKKVWFTARFHFGSYTGGLSLTENRPVGKILWERSWISLMLTLPALLLSTFLGVVIGLLAAFFRGRPFDRFLMMVATIGMSVSFLVYIIILQFLLVQKFRLFPDTGWEYSFFENIPYLLLPIFIQVLVGLGYDSRFYRAVMVEESTKDYITTAYAKGVPQHRVIFIHMLRNAMIPIVTRVFITLPFLFMGSFLLEIFFRIPGLGSTLINAITGKTDPPLIIGATAVLCSCYLVFLVLTDIMYAVVDPRIRLD